jgi:aminopeptidase N
MWLLFLVLTSVCISIPSSEAFAQSNANQLRGEYGRYRANNDLLYYHLDVRVDPGRKTISGQNTIRFKMLKDDSRIQLDLHSALAVDKIVQGETTLKYERDNGAVFVDFPAVVKAGEVVTIAFHYSGTPDQRGRFGGFTFGKDPQGRPWVYTSCEAQGASVWWPNKDQWRDEVESMDISVSAPTGLTSVCNGRLAGKRDLDDGYTRWDWHVSYPINNYCVSLNIATYEHFSDKHGDIDLDYYALPEDLAKAKVQFAQVKGMLDAFQHYFGEYPFKRDGYKLVQVPYSGMEHQSAITYGNGFRNGYLGRDWTGVGISPRFDFIIIHESGHEWFGNSVTAADRADMWIQEGWTTYMEALYVEHRWGKAESLKYLSGYRPKVQNRQAVLARRGVNAYPPVDQYFKGALFLNTLRSVVNDDEKWYQLIRGFYQRFKYQCILTEDVIGYFNEQTGKDLTPLFDQYLRFSAIPMLMLKFDEARGEVSYRWRADAKGFAMPVQVGVPGSWKVITPTSEWQTMKTPLGIDKFQVAIDQYYIAVSKPQQIAGAWESTERQAALAGIFHKQPVVRKRQATLHVAESHDSLTGNIQLGGDNKAATDFRVISFADDRLTFEYDTRWAKDGDSFGKEPGKAEVKGVIRVEARLHQGRLAGTWKLLLANGIEVHRGEWEAVRPKPTGQEK